MKEKEASKVRGFTANSLVIPLMILMAVLYVLIIVFILEVHRSTNELTAMMQRSGEYQQEATSLQAGVSILSETVGSYAVRPLSDDGSPNVGPLKAFAEELGKDRRGRQVEERFLHYDVRPEVRVPLMNAADKADEMLEVELRVISLLRSVYPLPPIPELAAIPAVELTAEELAMPEEARVGYAKQLILGQEFSQLKYYVSENITACNRLLREDFARAIQDTQVHIFHVRIALWVVIAAIVVLTTVFFVVFYLWLIRPMRSYARQIASDEPMKPQGSIREMLMLVKAYNGLLSRRNRLEEILRSAAETDALTGMPNRYSMGRYVLEIGDGGGSLAVLLFDVNFLKRVNDTEGHIAGDKLLRTAGICIRECFGTADIRNCFRIGGDEFAAILTGFSEADVATRIERFHLALEREKISVSVGYGYAEESDEDSFKALMAEADKRMYEDKKRLHELDLAGSEA